MTYMICFDFPEDPEPWFACWVRDALGYTRNMDNAATFDTEEIAARTLYNSFGFETRDYGVVVERGQVPA